MGENQVAGVDEIQVVVGESQVVVDESQVVVDESHIAVVDESHIAGVGETQAVEVGETRAVEVGGSQVAVVDGSARPVVGPDEIVVVPEDEMEVGYAVGGPVGSLVVVEGGKVVDPVLHLAAVEDGRGEAAVEEEGLETLDCWGDSELEVAGLGKVAGPKQC